MLGGEGWGGIYIGELPTSNHKVLNGGWGSLILYTYNFSFGCFIVEAKPSEKNISSYVLKGRGHINFLN
jgi:hypothetical protein